MYIVYRSFFKQCDNLKAMLKGRTDKYYRNENILL